MSNTKKNLGHVTAYAYYKAGGGTMTEAEFTEYMADFGDAAERAVDAANEAATSEANAASSATAAANSASAALTSEENANGAMMSAYSDANRADAAADTATSAKTDAVSAKTAAQSAKTAAETAASTATTKATAAANSATAAAGSATAAATSATNAAASAQSVASSAAQITQNAEDIDALKEDISNIDNVVYDIKKANDLSYKLGRPTSSGSVDDATNSFVRVDNFVRVLAGSVISVDDFDTFWFNVAFYTTPSVAGFSDWRSVNDTSPKYVVASDGYVIFSIGYRDGRALTDTSISQHFTISIFDSTVKDYVDTKYDDAIAYTKDNFAGQYHSLYNLINPSKIKNGFGVNTSTGKIQEDTTRAICPIYVSGLEYVAVDMTAWASVALYRAGVFVRVKPIDSSLGYFDAENADEAILIGNILNYENMLKSIANAGQTLESYEPYYKFLDDDIHTNQIKTSFEVGGITFSNGVDNNSVTHRCRTAFINARKGSTVANRISNKYKFTVLEYYTDDVYYYSQNQVNTAWYTTGYYVGNQDTAYIRIVAKRLDDQNITVEDLEEISGCFVVIPVSQEITKYALPAIPSSNFSIDTVPYDGVSDLTYSELINGYDALVESHPDYVSKETIGVDSSGEYTIYRYIFTPHLTNALTLNYSGKTYVNNANDFPTLLLEAGVHGGEIPITRGLLNAMTMICENWQNDPILEYLRFNFRIVVSPCAVPYGYNNPENGRYNANGVNINRNFNGYNTWQYGDPTPGTPNYRGASPLSEIESRYIYNMLDTYKKSALLYLSYHTYGLLSDYSKFLCWSWSTYIKQNPMYVAGNNSIKKISANAWGKHNYPYNAGNYIGNLQALNGDGYRGGYTTNQGNEFGIPSAEPEGIYYQYNDPSTKNSHSINCINAEWIIITVIESLTQLLH